MLLRSIKPNILYQLKAKITHVSGQYIRWTSTEVRYIIWSGQMSRQRWENKWDDCMVIWYWNLDLDLSDNPWFLGRYEKDEKSYIFNLKKAPALIYLRLENQIREVLKQEKKAYWDGP